MREFKIGESVYRTTPLDAFSQIHIGFKISPLFTRALSRVKGDMIPLEDIVQILSEVSRDDIDFVLKTALSCVQRKEGEAWANIVILSTGKMAYQDIPAIDLLRIAAEVLKEYIDPFFDGLVKLVSGTARSTPGS